jgi:hypothetical protein
VADNKSGSIRILIGILGLSVIALSILLLIAENLGVMLKTALVAAWQADIGLLLLFYGVNENRTKGKPKGNMYFVVGLAVLTSTVYTIYDLYTKLAQ